MSPTPDQLEKDLARVKRERDQFIEELRTLKSERRPVEQPEPHVVIEAAVSWGAWIMENTHGQRLGLGLRMCQAMADYANLDRVKQ